MEKIHIFYSIYKIKKIMITKTKLTITINKELLDLFDNYCELKSINKSKLISSMIKIWCENEKIETKDEKKN
jgi:metal-responsive CopG/Arc/MetJ family transcriptional regulator